MNPYRPFVAVTFFACVVTLHALGPQHAESKHRRVEKEPQKLLTRSYQMSKEFVPAERAFLLVRLVQEAPDAVDPSQVRKWVTEVWNVTETLPPSMNRIALRANALKAFSAIDDNQTLRLFDLIGDLSQTDETGDDPRAYAAITIFAAAYKKRGSQVVPELRSHALRLAHDGEYPYSAMLPIIRAEGQKSPDRAAELFGEALATYKRGSVVEKTNQDFVNLLSGLREQIPAPLMREALETCVAKLLIKKKTDDGESNYLSRVGTKTSSFLVSSKNDELLLKLIPLMETFEPSLLDKVHEQHPGTEVLNGGDPKVIESVRVEGAVSDSELLSAESLGIQRSRLEQIKAIAPQNPDEAQNLASTLSDIRFSAIAESAIAAGYASKNRQLAATAYDNAKRSLGALPDDRSRLELLASLAEAASAAMNLTEAEGNVESGLDLGSEMFQQEMDASPGKSAVLFGSFDVLIQLIRVGVKADPERTIALVGQLRNRVLCANLLVDVAQALAERRLSIKNGRAGSPF